MVLRCVVRVTRASMQHIVMSYNKLTPIADILYVSALKVVFSNIGDVRIVPH